jgi:TolA-binding protein
MRMALPFSPDRLLVYNDIPILCLMHERSCLDEVGKFDETLGTHEDWDLLIRLAHRYDFVQVRKLTAAISWREDGSSTTSGRRDDFRRTLSLIHDRYRPLAAGKPEVLQMQAQARSGITAPAAPASSANTAAFSNPVERAHDLISQAQALVARGQVGQARETLAAGVDLAQHAPELVVALADVFATEGKVDTACELLRQITRLHPSHQAAADRRVAILAEASARTTAQRAAQRAFAAH